MIPRREFHPLQAEEIARAFNAEGVDYLFEGIVPVANLRDIIASKRASGRQKDRVELPLLESFQVEFNKRHPAPPRSAAGIASDGPSPGHCA